MACLHTLNSSSLPSAHAPLHTAFLGAKIPKIGFRFPNRVKSSRFSRYTPSAVSTKEFLLASQPTFYDLLGISHDVSLVDIKQAYRQMARKYHPDVSPANQSEESTRRFIEIQEAYETLSDPRRRAIYDRAVVNGLGTVGRSWSFRPCGVEDKDFQMGHWRSQWNDQLNGLRRRSASKAENSESWASKMRKQREQTCNTL